MHLGQGQRTRAWLPIALAVPVALAGCPGQLNDWRISRSDARDASVDAAGLDAGVAESGGGGSSGSNDGSSSGGSSESLRDGSIDATGSGGSSLGGSGSSSGGSSGSSSSGSSGSSSGGSGGSSGSCPNDLSNIHDGDFHIDFEVLGAESGGPLLEQRSVCDPYSVDWLIAEQDKHNIIVQVSDGNYASLESVATINDGIWHHVVVARISGTMSITMDGQLDNSIPNATSLTTLALLQIGKSACAPPFAGQIKNVCIKPQ
jgi:hypothetical protein